MGIFGFGRSKSSRVDKLRAKKDKVIKDTDWRFGSILDGAFDKQIKKIDKIDEKINRKERKARRREDRREKRKGENKSYGVHREHGWYLPNDD